MKIRDTPEGFWERWLTMNELERPKHLTKIIPLLKKSMKDDETLMPGCSTRLLNAYLTDLEMTIRRIEYGQIERSKKPIKKQKSSVPRPKKRL